MTRVSKETIGVNGFLEWLMWQCFTCKTLRLQTWAQNSNRELEMYVTLFENHEC